jgi:elongation factor Ts
MEMEIEKAKLETEKKPQEVMDKILEGKKQKFFSQVCLLKQPYYKNPDITVEDLLNEKTAAIGEKIAVRRFARFELGK